MAVEGNVYLLHGELEQQRCYGAKDQAWRSGALPVEVLRVLPPGGWMTELQMK